MLPRVIVRPSSVVSVGFVITCSMAYPSSAVERSRTGAMPFRLKS